VAENQPANKNRMTSELFSFAARLREIMTSGGHCFVNALISRGSDEALPSKLQDETFDTLALELFALQFKHNAAYREICEARRLTPKVVEHWAQIPAVPTAAFKELDLTCLPPNERTTVFHSSGTTEQRSSRHYHSAESLKVYEASLLPWFLKNGLPDLRFTIYDLRLVCLTPPPAQAPHSSLVHMFETIRQKPGGAETVFVGKLAADGSWILDFDATLAALSPRASRPAPHALLLLGTAFSFVHLLDFLGEQNLSFQLPPGSCVMETGGYKGRSRTMPKAELHALVTRRLGIPQTHIVCEYGMSELSSQAYDRTIQRSDSVLPRPGPLPKERENCRQSAGESIVFGNSKERTLLFPLPEGEGQGEGKRAVKTHYFHFPPWARAQVVSPETGHEVADGKTGLIRVFDLANVFSVMAIQTEDLGVRRGDGFELMGRAAQAEPRGCSLMTLEGSASSLPRSKGGIDKAMPSKK
jgi:hypothetical protein